MREVNMKWLSYGLAALLALAPPAALAAEKKADSIEELARMYDVSSCRECHAEVFAEWEKSYHAKSLVGSPRTMATIASTVTDGLLKEYTYSGAKAVKDLTVEHLMICAKCHLPQLKDATDKVAREIAQAAIDGAAGDEDAREKLGQVGINCLICHNQKAIIHKWTDDPVEANVVYGSKDGAHPHSRFTKMKKSETLPESIMCGQCHGTGPNFELAEPSQCATLYGSYLHAYVPAGGTESCQDCHIRREGAGHYMPGYRDPLMAGSAVEVAVATRGYYFLAKAGDSIPIAAVTVQMAGRAGHRIPDG
jgi:hypothetical protein